MNMIHYAKAKQENRTNANQRKIVKKWLRGYNKQLSIPKTQRIGQRAVIQESHKH